MLALLSSRIGNLNICWKFTYLLSTEAIGRDNGAWESNGDLSRAGIGSGGQSGTGNGLSIRRVNPSEYWLAAIPCSAVDEVDREVVVLERNDRPCYQAVELGDDGLSPGHQQ